MYVRVVTTHVLPEKADEAIRIWRDSVMPAAKKQKGFKSARLLVDRKTGKSLAIGLWETEADLIASGEGSPYLKEQLAKFQELWTSQPVVENYELGAEV